MKKTATKIILACILMSTSAYAQHTKLGASFKAAATNSPVTVKPQAKSTATASRVIGASGYNFNNGVSYELEDTIWLTYTGERGHDSFFTNLKCDLLVGQTVVGGVPENNNKTTNTFDVDDNMLTSLEQSWNTGLSMWENDYNSIYTYDGNNNMLTSVSQNWNSGTNMWENQNKSIYTYDVNNNMLTRVSQSWDNVAMAWVNSSQYLYAYDVNGNIETVVYQNWDNVAMAWENNNKDTYTYDVNDDLTINLRQNWNTLTTSWENASRILYTYDGNHHMLTRIRQLDVLTVWENAEKNTYTYTGDDMDSDTYQTWNTIGSTWDNEDRSLYGYDGDHNIISHINQDWNTGTNTFDNDFRTQYTYNSFHQYTSIWTDNWNAGIWQVLTSDEKYNYYYETYNVTGVENIAAANSFSVYPVPAQNFVRVEKVWSEPQPFTVSITDMQGRLIRTFSEKATSKYSKTIDVNQLASGNYVIKIATANGKASYQQFNVIH